ncbi:hypothetical protein [Catenovulum agarivorans]|uniref:hypothetical protein n=1 Tax=Catenovulum agarivorans TaxID=1172192 RepID=UPI0002E079A3|nr:hypothetical protein [Catenovulum agarivorans]
MGLKQAKPGLVGVGVTAIQSIFQFLVLSVLALSFGVEQVGAFSFINAILIVVFMLFSLGLRQGYVLEHNSFGYRTFYYLRLISLLIASLVSWLIVSLINPEYLMLFFPLCLYRLTELMSELQWAEYQTKHKFELIFYSQGGRYLVCSIVFIVLSFLFQDFSSAIWAYAISGCIYIVLLDGRNIYRKIQQDQQKLQLVACFNKFWPLSIGLTAMSFQNNGSRFFLGLFAGDYVLGLFSIAYQLFNMPYMAFMSAANFYLKKMPKNLAEKRFGLKKLYVISFIFTGVCLLLWALLGNFLIEIFFGEAFKVIYIPVVIVLTAALFRYLAYCHQWRMMSEGLYSNIAKHQVVLSIFITLISFYAIYVYGYHGAYSALVFSCFCYYGYFAYLDRHEKRS